MKKAIDFFTAHPARFFFLAALLWGGFMCFLNYKDGADFSWHDLLVEANGMVFDLLVFGVLLSIYERLREKRDKIERLHEEIDDYRGWDEKEAMYRIVGAIKRLNKVGVSKIDLNACFLSNADLRWANLSGARMMQTDLSSASLLGANLAGAILLEANLSRASLSSANLSRADLGDAILLGAILREANLSGGDLNGAFVNEDWFEKLEQWEVIGREEIKAKYLIDKKGRLRERQ